MKGKISAIITTYKRDEGIVLNALKSVESQSYPVYEIIVVDDNPFNNGQESDLSRSIRFAVSEKAVYLKQPKGNAGANAARNLGIQNASGDYIAFLDDDDEWLPTKIEEEIQAFSNDNIGLVFCGGYLREMGGGYNRFCLF